MLRILSSRLFLLAVAVVLAPVGVQAQAATTCKDGTTSTATGRGACSGHGGVAKSTKATKSESKSAAKAAKSAPKSTKAAEKTTRDIVASDVKESKKAAKSSSLPAATAAPAARTTAVNTDPTNATAKCKDGTYSHAATHRGACSRHGGVAEWLKS